jgi:Arc/MetJ-type ribon-helix-helix transcriptional regulator
LRAPCNLPEKVLADVHKISYIVHMSKAPLPDKPSMSVNVRVSGALREHVERSASEGDYESVSEYVRDLIRKDKAAKEEAAFQRVKAELQAAFAEPRENYHTLTADEIRAFARQKRK